MSTYTDIADSTIDEITSTLERSPEWTTVENVTLEAIGSVRDGEPFSVYVAIVSLASGHMAARDGDTKEDAISEATRAAVSRRVYIAAMAFSTSSSRLPAVR